MGQRIMDGALICRGGPPWPRPMPPNDLSLGRPRRAALQIRALPNNEKGLTTCRRISESKPDLPPPGKRFSPTLPEKYEDEIPYPGVFRYRFFLNVDPRPSARYFTGQAFAPSDSWFPGSGFADTPGVPARATT